MEGGIVGKLAGEAQGDFTCEAELAEGGGVEEEGLGGGALEAEAAEGEAAFAGLRAGQEGTTDNEQTEEKDAQEQANEFGFTLGKGFEFLPSFLAPITQAGELESPGLLGPGAQVGKIGWFTVMRLGFYWSHLGSCANWRVIWRSWGELFRLSTNAFTSIIYRPGGAVLAAHQKLTSGPFLSTRSFL